MKIGSLFSGIGGLELGLEWSGLGYTVWQVESNELARQVLSRRWPQVERYADVKEVGKHNLNRVEIICGGFPCTNVSSAGAREGLSGSDSSLWYEQLRIISELQPRWVVVENVASGRQLWADTVTRCLANEGYEVLQIPMSAADVGAPHRRQRLFLLAYNGNTNDQGESMVPVNGTNAQGLSKPKQGICWRPEAIGVPLADGVPSELGLYGNAVVPQCSEVIGYIIRELEGR